MSTPTPGPKTMDIRGYAKPPSTRAASYSEVSTATPNIVKDGLKTWITRGANFVIAVSEAKAGAVLHFDVLDESMVIIPAGGRATVIASGASLSAGDPSPSRGDTLFIVPAGPSQITVGADGTVIQIFSTLSGDASARAGNANEYTDGAPEVATLVPWPEPIGGFKLRKYDCAEIEIDARFPGHSFRSTNLMANIFRPGTARRSEHKMSPHSHVDFEQGSLTLQGNYVHHLRYPWTTDKGAWRDDEHRQISSPSVTIIPAGVIHTSQDVGEGVCQMVDIFSPPRLDFSMISGFVVNADEYPMPPAGPDA